MMERSLLSKVTQLSIVFHILSKGRLMTIIQITGNYYLFFKCQTFHLLFDL